jgi:hypothetical protein
MRTYANKSEDRRVLLRPYTTVRGFGVPQGTLLIIAKTQSGVFDVDYTTPYGAYGKFIALKEDMMKILEISVKQER